MKYTLNAISLTFKDVTFESLEMLSTEKMPSTAQVHARAVATECKKQHVGL